MNAIALSPDRRHLATAGDRLRLVSLQGGSASLGLTAEPDDPYAAVQFSPAGTLLVAVSAGGRGEAYDLSGRKVGGGHVCTARTAGLAVSPDGAEAVVGDRSGAIHFLTLPSLNVRESISLGADPVQDIRYSPDGRRLAVAVGEDGHPWPATRSGRVVIYSPPGRAPVTTFAWFWGVPKSVAFSPDGRQVAVGAWAGGGGSLEVWRVVGP